jgi:branched-chain amino acid aminotransferase
MGDSTNEKHDIKNSPYWKNLYGRDLEDTEIKGIFQDMSDEDIEIYLKGSIFLQEAYKEDYSVKTLEKLVFPWVRSDWGDFSDLHNFVMEKKNIDWSSIGFGYIKTDKRYVSNYKNGAWDEGTLTDDANVVLSECAGVLQYAQTVFEGLKAYTTEDGRIVCFRPDLNASRMADSAKRLEMPAFPEDRFVKAVEETVRANAAYVPPYGSGATLYIRPYMFGSNPVIGVKPADEYQFRMFCTPVGPYFKGGAKPITIKVSDFDRAAPHGTGHIKAGLNYAMSLHAIVTAHQEGYDENMYLDAATRTKVEETGGANFIFVTKDGTVVTPKSNSILPSITRRSLMVVAEKYLGLKVEHREVYFDEVKDFAECGLCGTAAVISPVGKIVDHGKEICFPSGMEKMGPVIQKLYDTLTGIQMGRIEAPEGWIKEIKVD